MNILPKSDYIAHKFHNFPKKIQENFAETQAIPNHKKLNNFPKKLKLPKDYPYLVLQNP